MAPAETNRITGTESAAKQTETTPLRGVVICRGKRSGFTLIELLVVMGVIGVLAVIANSGFTAMKDNARVARASAEIRGLEKDISAYFIDKGGYPANYAALVAYLDKGELLDPWGQPYVYNVYVSGSVRHAGVVELSQDYDLYSKGKDAASTDLSISDPDSDSNDDIIRAGNGSYVGTVKQYLN